jgi:hypothetical protein
MTIERLGCSGKHKGVRRILRSLQSSFALRPRRGCSKLGPESLAEATEVEHVDLADALALATWLARVYPIARGCEVEQPACR